MCRFVFEFLNRDVVSYMAVGIDLNYFSVGRWYYLFFLLHASLGIVGTRSQNSTPSNMVFYQERVTVCRRLPIDNEL